MSLTNQNTSFRSGGCIKKSIEKMIKQGCFNKLKKMISLVIPSSTTQLQFDSLTQEAEAKLPSSHQAQA